MPSISYSKNSGSGVAAAVALSIVAASGAYAQQPMPQASSTPAEPAKKPPPDAAAAPAPVVSELRQVIVTGTRQLGVEAAQSAAPIQVVSPQALAANSGSGDLMSALAQTVPSFTMQAFGFDMAGQTLQAKLRGVSPNDVLVLVNGKRRDTTANLAVDGGSVYQGGAGVDLNFVPMDAIDHVEVLTQGAAAQYGSDAMAGVINIILKKSNSGGLVSGTYGEDFDGQGPTTDYSLNLGLQPLPGGYLNVTAEERRHGHTDVGGPYPPAIRSIGTYPNSNMTQLPGYPYINHIMGDAQTDTKLLMFNAGLPVGGSVTFYLFGSYGNKRATSFENYRPPQRISYTDPATGVKTYPLPFGFQPKESTHELDIQINGGFQGTLADWDWDLGSGYGTDRAKLYTLDSIGNSYLLNGLPTVSDFYDGLLKTTQWSTTLDVNRDFDVGMAGPLNIAWGLEYRRETYTIGAGIPESYIDGGAQSFPGFAPTDAGAHDRKNESAYVDVAGRPIAPLKLDIAGRYEHYSDFGSAKVGKLTGRWDFAPQFAVRGTVSSGFRAPTLAEGYYSSTNVGPSTAFEQLPPDSAAGKILGIGNGLEPEKSLTYSLGFVWRPIPQIITTLDFYQIAITNRIVGSGSLYGTISGTPTPDAGVINSAIAATGAELDPYVLANGTTGINVFVNGIDTRTRGADLSFDMPVAYAFGHVDWTVGGTYSETVLTNTPPTLSALPDQALFDQTAISDLTTASPRFQLNLGARWTYDKATVNLTEKLYGPSSEYESDNGDNEPTGVPGYFKTRIPFTPITNLDVGYQFTHYLKVDVGAINLLNRFPPHHNGTLLANQWAANDGGYVSWYPTFSPFGIDGGYYYAKASITF
jgi:iron complex outermembrane recepter protein